MTPEISIVIPTINRYDDLKNTLNDISNQSFKNYEILIIDQTAKEMAQEITFKNTRYFLETFKSASKARNLGLKLAKSNIVLFLDDDVIIENNNFLQSHVNHFKNEKTSGVAGAILNLDKKWTSKLPKKASKKHLGWIYTPRNYNKSIKICDGGAGNLAVRKDWAIVVGGMDENYDKGAYREESDFCLRYTQKYGDLNYDPEAFLVHIGNPSGGTRSWSNSNGIIHARQHMFGAWYFMFNILPLVCWPEYSYLTLRRFIIHKKLISRFYFLPKALFNFSFAFFHAIITKVKGPKHIS
ncbi:MAG: glycosyltransferase family 2 protein [Vicingaceae bacterium]